MICLASARVHFEVKSDAGSCAVWLWGVGRGKPGVGAGICVFDGGSDGSLACAEGTARKAVAATVATRAAAAGRHRSIRGVLGCLCIFCSSRGVTFVEDGQLPLSPELRRPR